jgi:hypothetical protein
MERQAKDMEEAKLNDQTVPEEELKEETKLTANQKKKLRKKQKKEADGANPTNSEELKEAVPVQSSAA